MKKKAVLSVSIVLLLVIVVLACVACTPNSDNVKKKLEKNGYQVTVTEISSNAGDKYADMGATKVLSAYKGEAMEDYVYVVWFSDSEKLDKAYKDSKAQFDEMKKAYEEMGMGKEFDMKIVKKGKVLISGTATAVKLVG